jgi:carbon monoxide dehydrogenase subunit G
VISRAAVDAVTSPENVAAPDDGGTGLRAVRDDDVVAELRRLEGLGTGEARRLGREAVAHVGGYIEQVGSRGLRSGRARSAREAHERWWVPVTAVRK